MDYVGDLDSRLAHLVEPPQSKALTKKIVLLLKQLLPAIVPTLTTIVLEPVSSIHPYKILLPPSPDEKLRAAPRGTKHPYLHRPIAAMPNTPPRSGTTAIMTASCNPGAASKTTTITFYYSWEVLMLYAHGVDATRLAPIWFELAVVARYDFCPTLDLAC